MESIAQIINRHRGRRALLALNVLGLSVCIAAALLILCYVRFELSYDDFHDDGNRIYRVESRLYEGDMLTDNWATTTFGHAPVMARELPGIESYVRVTAQDREQEVTYGDRQYIEQSYCYTEPAFFDLFNFAMTRGDKQGQLVRPFTAVVSENAARRYFGGDDPVGKVLTFKTPTSEQHFEVTGVIADMPRNSHLRYDFLLSYSSIPEARRDIWYIHGVYTYLRLSPGADPKEIERGFEAISDNYRTAALRHKSWRVELVALSDIHLNPRKSYEKEEKGSRTAVDILFVMAMALLLTGWVNALNLTTAHYLERSREYGLRKIFGASAGQIVARGLLESALLNLAALLLAWLWIALLLPFAGGVTGCDFASGIFGSAEGWMTMAGIFVVGVVAVGLYPSLLLTRVTPADFMRGRMLHSRRGNATRRLLVVVQSMASFILVVGTIVVIRQVDYMQRESDDELYGHVVVVKYPSATEDMSLRISDFKKRLQQEPFVGGVAVSGAVPGIEVANYFTNRPYGSDKSQVKLIQMFAVDYDYLDFYAPEFVCGRGFSDDYGGELNRVVVNEEAARLLGYASPAEILGEQLAMEVVGEPLEVIGVVRDYAQQSYAEPYKPIMFFLRERVPIIATPYISVKVEGAVDADKIERIRQIYARYFPMAMFSYFRLSDYNYGLYRSDRNFSHIFACASLLAVFVACLGLWIMTLFSTMARVKEIGIRKVLGADRMSLFAVLTREMALLTVVSVVLATPISVVIMSEWLSGYAFHIALPWWAYAVAFVFVAAIGLLTVARQIWRAIRLNPIDILRNE